MNIEKVEKCYGCTACKSICPNNCISMQPNKEGFLIPVIDKSKCINCGLCTRVCPRLANKLTDNKVIKSYAVKNKKEEIRLNSTSGGFFSAIADYFIKNNGVIYGCILDDDLKIKHVRTEKDYKKMIGSKYVQSDLQNTFIEIQKDLKNNRMVLFTGTPCQCSGLKLYLRKDYSNLYVIDLICHGVPSPLLWKEYINYLTKKNGEILKYNFRSKIEGWHTHTEVIEYKDGNIEVNTRDSNINKNLFNTNYNLRNSCYDCQFSSDLRIGDITIGDAWGLQNINKKFDDNKGINLICEEADIEQYSKYNPNLVKPTFCGEERDKFWNTYFQKGYIALIKKYTDYSFKRRTKEKIKKMLIKLKIMK